MGWRHGTKGPLAARFAATRVRVTPTFLPAAAAATQLRMA
jgi:hypothetical protein